MALRSFVHNEKIVHAVVQMINRYGKTAIVHSTGKELLDRHIASKMTLGKAAVRGVFPIQKYVAAVYQHQKALAGYQARADDLQASDDQSVMQKYLDALRRTLEKADGPDKIFTHHITNKFGKDLMFCANKQYMNKEMPHVPDLEYLPEQIVQIGTMTAKAD